MLEVTEISKTKGMPVQSPKAEALAEQTPGQILREVATQHKMNGRGFSLRATAGKLGISPSYWSRILGGKLPLPPSLLPEIIRVLQLNSSAVECIQRSFLREFEREDFTPKTGLTTTIETPRPRMENYQRARPALSWILEDWIYVPILNLFTIANEDLNPGSIAKRLGIRKDQASFAIEKLKKHGLLTAGSNGTLVRSEQRLRFPTDRSHPSIRSFHRGMMRKASEELDSSENFDQRLITGVNFAACPMKIKAAQAVIDEAMHQVAEIMSSGQSGSEIYQLNVQLFPLTKK